MDGGLLPAAVGGRFRYAADGSFGVPLDTVGYCGGCGTAIGGTGADAGAVWRGGLGLGLFFFLAYGFSILVTGFRTLVDALL